MKNRRDFLKLTMRSAVLITAGNKFTPFLLNNRLPLREEIALRFAIVSDGHYGQPDTDYEKNHDAVIAAINNEFHDRGVDFTFVNGDLFHNDVNFMEPVKQKWNTLAMPHYVSHGNHDQTTEANWLATFGNQWYYTFEKNNNGFIVLNTANEKGDYVCPDLQTTNALLEQNKQKENLFVFMHITPYTWTKGGIDCPEIVNSFSKYKNIKAIFHGHDHDMDDVKEKNNLNHFFDAHIAGNWGLPYIGYRIVEILNNSDILTYQMNSNTNKQVNSKSL